MDFFKFILFVAISLSFNAWAQESKKTLSSCSIHAQDWPVLTVSGDTGLQVKKHTGCMVLFVTPKSEVNEARTFSLVTNDNHQQKLVAFGKLILDDDEGFVHNEPLEASWVKFPRNQQALKVAFSASRSGAGFGVFADSSHFFYLKDAKFHLVFSYSQKECTQYTNSNSDCNEATDGRSTYQYLKTGDADFPDIKTTSKFTTTLTCDENGKEKIKGKNTNVQHRIFRWRNGQYFLAK